MGGLFRVRGERRAEGFRRMWGVGVGRGFQFVGAMRSPREAAMPREAATFPRDETREGRALADDGAFSAEVGEVEGVDLGITLLAAVEVRSSERLMGGPPIWFFGVKRFFVSFLLAMSAMRRARAILNAAEEKAGGTVGRWRRSVRTCEAADEEEDDSENAEEGGGTEESGIEGKI